MGLFSRKPKKEEKKPAPAPSKGKKAEPEVEAIDLEAADMEASVVPPKVGDSTVVDSGGGTEPLVLGDGKAEEKLDIDELTDDLQPLEGAPAAKPDGDGIALEGEPASPEAGTVAVEVKEAGQGDLDLSGLDGKAEPPAPEPLAALEPAAPAKPEKPRLKSPEGKMLSSCSQCGVEYYLLPELIGREALCVRCRKVFVIEFGAAPPFDTAREEDLPPYARTPAAPVAAPATGTAATTVTESVVEFVPDTATDTATTALGAAPQVGIEEVLPDLDAPTPAPAVEDDLAVDLDVPMSAPVTEDDLAVDSIPAGSNGVELQETETGSAILETIDPGLKLELPENTDRRLVLTEANPSKAGPPVPAISGNLKEYLDDGDELEEEPEFGPEDPPARPVAAPEPPAPVKAAAPAAPPKAVQDDDLGLDLDSLPDIDEAPPARKPAVSAPKPAPRPAAPTPKPAAKPVAARKPAPKQATPAPEQLDELEIDLDLGAQDGAPPGPVDELDDLEIDLDDLPEEPQKPATKAEPATRSAPVKAPPARAAKPASPKPVTLRLKVQPKAAPGPRLKKEAKKADDLELDI